MDESDVNREIERMEKNMTEKLYVVDVMTTFRMRYVVKARSEEHALDEVVCNEHDTEFKEFSQEHIGTHIFSSREVDTKEYLELFEKDNYYLKSWTNEQKFVMINHIDYKDEE